MARHSSWFKAPEATIPEGFRVPVHPMGVFYLTKRDYMTNMSPSNADVMDTEAVVAAILFTRTSPIHSAAAYRRRQIPLSPLTSPHVERHSTA